MYYFKLIGDCEDVRVQNREAFGLFRLGFRTDEMEQIMEYGEAEEEEEAEDLLASQGYNSLAVLSSGSVVEQQLASENGIDRY